MFLLLAPVCNRSGHAAQATRSARCSNLPSVLRAASLHVMARDQLMYHMRYISEIQVQL